MSCRLEGFSLSMGMEMRSVMSGTKLGMKLRSPEPV